MSRLLILIFLIGNVFSISKSLADTQTASQIQIVFAANMQNIAPNNQGGFSRLSSLLKDVRQQQPNTIFAFGGGSLGPSPMSSFDRGSHIIDLLNTLEPDLMTVRKREFSYYEDELSLRADEAAFPLIASNIIDPLTTGNIEGLFNSFIVNKKDKKIGFMSVIEEDVVQEYLLNRVKVFESPTIIEGQAKKLRRQGADLIVMVFSKKQLFYTELLDNGIIDLAIRARSDQDNADLNNLSHPHIYSLSQDNRALILDVIWPTTSSTHTITAQEVLLADYEEDPIVTLQIDGYSNRLDRLLNQIIGQVSVPLNTLRNSVRSGENAFANFVADTIKEYENADIAFINGGVIRGNKKYDANTMLTRKDIATELPFRSRITRVSATGAQIKQALEHGVAEVELIRGRFPQVSGIKYSFSTALKPGSRIIDITINDQELDPKKSYTVATSDYIANGGDGFISFSNKLEVNSMNSSLPLISDIVILNIQKHKIISPTIESRAERVNK